jgi:hypothetical protein
MKGALLYVMDAGATLRDFATARRFAARRLEHSHSGELNGQLRFSGHETFAAIACRSEILLSL